VSDPRRHPVRSGSRSLRRSLPLPRDAAEPEVFRKIHLLSGAPNGGGPESDVPNADGAWDRIADLLVELALSHDPSILEPVDRADL
jgi:hypothetical protein